MNDELFDRETLDRVSREEAEIQKERTHKPSRIKRIFGIGTPTFLVLCIAMSLCVSGVLISYWLQHEATVDKTITINGAQELNTIDLKLKHNNEAPVLLKTTTSVFPLSTVTLTAGERIVERYDLNSSGGTGNGYQVFFNDTAIQQTLLNELYTGITFSIVNHNTGLPFFNNEPTLMPGESLKFDLIFDVDALYLDPGVGNDLPFYFAMNVTRI